MTGTVAGFDVELRRVLFFIGKPANLCQNALRHADASAARQPSTETYEGALDTFLARSLSPGNHYGKLKKAPKQQPPQLLLGQRFRYAAAVQASELEALSDDVIYIELVFFVSYQLERILHQNECSDCGLAGAAAQLGKTP